MDPGVGYGGSCFPKDVKALIKIGQALNLDTTLLDAVERVNAIAKENFARKIIDVMKGEKNLAIWGLSFKPNTDDIREAPSLFVLNRLLEQKFSLSVYDPAATSNINNLFGSKLIYFDDPYEAVKNSSALVVLTEWNEFKQADLRKIKSLLKKPIVFDGRNIYDPALMKGLGFSYYSIGRQPTR